MTRRPQAITLAPCVKCPFRKDVPIYLRQGRRQEIAEDIFNGGTFSCHETVEYDTDDGDPDDSGSMACHGAAKALLAVGGSTNYMRIMERLGFADLDRVEAHPVEVWGLNDWVRLAEGATGEAPVWEIGDENGVETCHVVGPNCEAPAGFMLAAGAMEGLVAAGLECEACGEATCEACMGDDGVCLDCSDDGGDW